MDIERLKEDAAEVHGNTLHPLFMAYESHTDYHFKAGFDAAVNALAENLHREIMNLPCDHGDLKYEPRITFKMGHRDARHAAAELALTIGKK
jgi:hypothetical protein